MKAEKQEITWAEIDNLMFHLSIRIRDSGKEFDRIIGMPRGGLVPAVLLSYRLDIPLELHNPTQPLPLYPKDLERTLIVDEICDTGRTLGLIQKHNEAATTAVLYYNTASPIEPDFAGMSDFLTKWLVFPWEKQS